MKRSTLTLSILTALLVSACGGSSSNDEQTKDPTPPKVTPTQPSTPSTGKTPTTGKKEPKKEEASSSSSDSTPPISSGSAPSGGKPIVIAGEPKKEIKPDPKPDEDENTEEDKPEDKPSDALSDIAKKLQESETAFKAARTASEEQNLKVTQAKRDVSDLREKISALLSTPLTTQELTVAALTKKVDANTAKKINDLYDKYVDAEKAAADAAATADELQAAADAAEVTHKENETASKIETFKKEWAEKPQVLSVTEYVAARTAEMKAQGQYELEKKKNINLTAQRNVLGDAKKEKGRIQKLNEKLEALKKLNSKDPEVQAKIDAATKRTKEELADANERWEELNKEVKHANTDETLAKNKVKTIDEEDLKKKETTANNFGVAGGKDFAADKIFLGVQKAVLNDKKWTITFDGMNEGVEFNPTTVNTEIGASGAYGSSGTVTVGTEKKPVAFKLPKTNAASIYGYFDDKFYSAGTVTTPKKMDEVPTAKVGKFSGKSFLVDTAGNKLVSDVEGTVRLGGEKKEFEGDFQNFQKVGTDLEPIAKGRLASSVRFKADIDKNTFKPAADTDAKVYGYFYGTDASEAGGLVEYQDVFHGSFGGAINRD